MARALVGFLSWPAADPLLEPFRLLLPGQNGWAGRNARRVLWPARTDPSWRQVYLLSEYVSRLHQAGKIAAEHDCYAIAPPPLVGGPDPWGEPSLAVEAAMVMEVEVLQRLYADHVAKALEAD
jgi:hypothetical protein